MFAPLYIGECLRSLDHPLAGLEDNLPSSM